MGSGLKVAREVKEMIPPRGSPIEVVGGPAPGEIIAAAASLISFLISKQKGRGGYFQMKALREQQLSLPHGGLRKLFRSSALNGMAFVSCFPIIICYLGDSLGSRKGQRMAGGTKFPAVIQSWPLLRKSDLSKVTSKCLQLL